LATLSIDLQDGFAGDTVVIRSGGEEVARLDGVTTNFVISRADAVDVELPDGELEVQVEVPTQGLTASRSLVLADGVFLTANVVAGSLKLAQVPERPVYL
jgi:hypothetical protein